MRRKWFFRSFIGVIVLSIIGLFVTLWLLKAPIISAYLSKKLGVNVSIGRIHLSKSSVEIYDFRIHNPPGSQTKTAFSAEHIFIGYSFDQLRADPSTIRLIDIKDCFLGIEFYNLTGSKNNWATIIANLEKKKDRKKEAKEIIIQKLALNNLSIQIRGQGLFEEWKKVKQISNLEFRNISSKKGFPTDWIIKELFKQSDLNKYLEEILNPENWFNRFFSP